MSLAKLTKPTLTTVLALAAALGLGLSRATVAQAVQRDWLPTVDGTYLWHNTANWSGSTLPTDDGGQVAYIFENSATQTINFNGTDVNLGASRVRVHHGNWTFDDLTTGDPALKARLTVDNLFADNCNGNPVYNVRITANEMTTDHNMNQVVTLNAPFTIGHVKKGWPGSQGREILEINASPEVPITTFDHRNWITNFNAPGAITTLNVITGHSTNTFNANAALTIGTLNMTLTPNRPDPQTFNFNDPGITIGTLNWQNGHWKASVDGGVAALGATPTIPTGASLIVAAPQVTLPTMLTVPGGTALMGDMTNFVYSGGGQNITFGDGAVFIEQVAPAAGPLQASDLPPGVQVYRGILTASENATTDAPGTAYKGIAFGNFYTTGGELRGTYTSGGGDLNIRIDGPIAAHYNNGPYFIGDGVSTTANFEMGPTGTFNIRRAFNHTGGSSANQITDPNQILTFNFTRDPGNERLNIFTSDQQGRVFPNQIINVSNGRMGLAGVINMGIEGAITLTDGTWDIGTAFTPLSTGTLTLAGRTTLELPSARGTNVKYDALEALGSRFTYSGQPMVLFGDENGGPWIYTFDLDRTSGTTPVLAEFLANVDYGSNHYHPVDIGGDGLLIGDGKFLADAGTTNATSSYVAHNTTGSMPTIMPGQPGAITMGFAASVKNLSIGLEVVAPDATIQVGTTDPNRLLTSGGTGFTAAGIPTMRVTFQQNVNAKGVKVESGTGQFNQDLDVDTLSIRTGATLTMAGGRTATVNGTLSGGGTFSGGNGVLLAGTGTLAPGDSPGTLTGSLLSVDDGATYQWEILDPDGTAGDPGGWDLFMGGVVDLDPDNDNDDTINFEIVDLGIPREIAAAERFLVASGTDLQLPNNLAVNFSVVPDVAVWDLGAAALVPAPGGPGFELFLTGVTATFQTEVIPEPSTFVLAVLGLLLLAASRFRRRERS